MANFVAVRIQLNSISRAAGLLPQLQNIYQQAQFAQSAISDYQANTDPNFNQAVNTIFSASERAQLASMLSQLNTLVSNWTTNHTNLMNTQP